MNLTSTFWWYLSSLVISGSRATDWWKNNDDSHSDGNGSANGNGSVYHRRELAQGPYRAVWRLPKNADDGAVTAEFMYVECPLSLLRCNSNFFLIIN